MRALLECAWSAAVETTQQPFRSKTWTAAIHIVCDRDGSDLARTRRPGLARFEQAVRREIVKRGGTNPAGGSSVNSSPPRRPAGVLARCHGALERVQLLLVDWAGAAGETQWHVCGPDCIECTRRRPLRRAVMGQTALVAPHILGLARARPAARPCR
jgi:hypothetical protein